MHSQFLSTILIALCVANGVLSIPLDIAPLAAASTPAEQTNEANLNNAKNLANKNILKMQHVLNNPTQPGHQEMINAAFGTDPSLNMNHVKNTVQKLKTGTVPVNLATAPGSQTVAYTQYDDSTNPMTPQHVEFGKKYHAKGTSDDARAATLIHEGTHHLADTGDYIKNNKMLNGGDPEETKHNGYATGMEPKKTAAALNSDKNWQKMRDGHQPAFGDAVPATKDLHKNAESYAQFSAMCGAAVSDAAVGLRRRALAAGNWDEAAGYLIRRQACSIRNRPKKAAGGKAVNAKTTSQPSAKKALLSSKTPKGGLRKTASSSRKSPSGGVSKLGGKKGLAANAAKKSALGRSKVGGSKATGLGRSKGLSKSTTRAGGAKSLAKGAKALAGARGKGSVKSRVAKGAVKGLAKGASRAKTSGSAKRPLSKTKSSASKRPVNSAAKKNVVRPGSKKPINRSAAKKTTARPTARKGANNNLKKSVVAKKTARPAANKNVGRPASNNARKTVNNRKTNVPKQQSARPANVKKTVPQPQRAAAKVYARPAPQRQTSAKSVPAAAKPVVKSSKGRRDLEFQL